MDPARHHWERDTGSTIDERAVAAASVRAEGPVVATQSRRKADDIVEVVGIDAWGREARWRLQVRSVPAHQVRATLLLSYGKGRLTATPWLRLSGDEVWYQRMMWEPWLTGALGRRAVQARRAGRRGPWLVDIPGQGRLWPAGRAWRREPSIVERLEAGNYNGKQARRWPILCLALGFGTVGLVGLSVAAGVAIALSFVGVVLFYGAPPILLNRRP